MRGVGRRRRPPRFVGHDLVVHKGHEPARREEDQLLASTEQEQAHTRISRRSRGRRPRERARKASRARRTTKRTRKPNASRFPSTLPTLRPRNLHSSTSKDCPKPAKKQERSVSVCCPCAVRLTWIPISSSSSPWSRRTEVKRRSQRADKPQRDRHWYRAREDERPATWGRDFGLLTAFGGRSGGGGGEY